MFHNIRRKQNFQRQARRAAILAISLAASSACAQVFTTDTALPGTAFSPGVRGQAVPAVTIDRGEYTVGVPKALEVSDGSSIRGVAGGIEAELFNWKTRNNSARAGTLDYLRYSRDHNADLFITTNMRGLVQPDPNNPGSQLYYDTSIPTLASLAADWVRYTNHIVPTYRQGQTITDSRDAAILNSLTWSSSTPGDNFDKLLNTTEAAVPKVKYWEIGNEPRVGVSAYKVTNSYTFLAPPATPDATHKTDYRERYAALTAAMRAEDPTIKVGPAIQYLSSASEQAIIDSILQRQPDGTFLPIDFIGYHPYQTLNTQTTAAGIATALRGVYDDHLAKINNIRSHITAAGRDPNSIAFVASEHNVSNWTSNDTVNEAQMAHALGNVETVFSFARLGVQDAHYWVWPAHRFDGTEYPEFLASEKLRDHMGDTILSVSAANSDNLHLYTTRDSNSGEIALWGLNFDNDNNITRTTQMLNVGGRGKITLYTLGALSGATTLFSANLASDMAGGPTHAVDWKTSDLTGTRLVNLPLTFPAATISLLTIEKWRQESLPGDVNADGKVDSADTSIITANNNQTERNWWQGDMTGDGLVNSADANIVAANQGLNAGTKWSAQSGAWVVGSNWVGGVVPNGVGAGAYLAGSITAPRNLTLNSAITVGTIVFDNANTYDLVGTGSLMLQTTGSSTAKAFVIQGDQRISIPLTIASDTTVNLAAGTSLRLGSTLTINTGKAFTQSGAGLLSFEGAVSVQSGGTITFGSSSHVAGLTLASTAKATIAPGADKVVMFDSLALAGATNAWTSQLDLKDNDAIVHSTSAARVAKVAEITNQIKQGFNTAGTIWTGQGIVSTLAGNGASNVTALGVIYNDFAAAGAAPGAIYTTFAGASVSVNDILIKYTYFGDADLDGRITSNDYFQIDSGFLTAKTGWINGDFDYNGTINSSDYFLIDKAFLSQSAALAPAAAITSVPEPASLALLLTIPTLALSRRRHGPVFANN